MVPEPTDYGYVRSDFVGVSDEGLDLLRAYTKSKEGQKVLSTCRGYKTASESGSNSV